MTLLMASITCCAVGVPFGSSPREIDKSQGPKIFDIFFLRGGGSYFLKVISLGRMEEDSNKIVINLTRTPEKLKACNENHIGSAISYSTDK